MRAKLSWRQKAQTSKAVSGMPKSPGDLPLMLAFPDGFGSP